MPRLQEHPRRENQARKRNSPISRAFSSADTSSLIRSCNCLRDFVMFAVWNALWNVGWIATKKVGKLWVIFMAAFVSWFLQPLWFLSLFRSISSIVDYVLSRTTISQEPCKFNRPQRSRNHCLSILHFRSRFQDFICCLSLCLSSVGTLARPNSLEASTNLLGGYRHESLERMSSIERGNERCIVPE